MSTVPDGREFNRAERLTLRFSNWLMYRQFIRGAFLDKELAKAYRKAFRDIHLRYYADLILKGRAMPQAPTLALNFVLIRSAENLRTLLLCRANDVAVGFFFALRSQLEINATLVQFTEDPAYALDFLNKIEDRDRKGDPNLVKNVLTLVQKYARRDAQIGLDYERLSLLIHPNPTAVLEAAAIRALSKGSHAAGHYLRPDGRLHRTWTLNDDAEVEVFAWMRKMLIWIDEMLVQFDALAANAALGDERVRTEFLDLVRKSAEGKKRAGIALAVDGPSDDAGVGKKGKT